MSVLTTVNQSGDQWRDTRYQTMLTLFTGYFLNDTKCICVGHSATRFTLKPAMGLGLVGDGVDDLVDLCAELWLLEKPLTAKTEEEKITG